MNGLDHVVICVNDLEATAKTFTDFGFTLTPRAKHPFGTHNQLIQLDNFFLEFLTVAEPEKLPAPVKNGFSFALFNQYYLNQREGLSMIVLDSQDFRKDHENAKSAGLKTYEPFEFSRAATLPDGTEQQVSFGLNFVSDPLMPMAGFFSCQQFNPEHFWQTGYQKHANTAAVIKEVAIVTQNPQQFQSFIASFTGSSQIKSNADQAIITTARGNIALRTPANFETKYQTLAPQLSNGPLVAGLSIGVENLEMVTVQNMRVNGMSLLFEGPKT